MSNDKKYIRNNWPPMKPGSKRIKSKKRVAIKEGKIPRGSNMTYASYLKTGHWQRKRKAALKYFGYRCCECGAEDVVLHVHHTHYNDKFREKLEDLRVMCVTCHDKEHDANTS